MGRGLEALSGKNDVCDMAAEVGDFGEFRF